MLNKNQSNKRNSWKYAVVLPLMGAFLFLFQVKVVAQEKITVKQETEIKEAIDLTKFKIEKDLTPLTKGKEIYVDGEKINEEKLAKINPSDIKSIDVIKKSSKSVIVVTTKNATNQLTKPIKITDKDIYINGIKSTKEDFNKLDQSTVDKVDVNTFENTVRVATKIIAQVDDKKNIQSVLRQDIQNQPLIIVDGKRQESTFKMEDLPTEQIKEVYILKGKLAEDKYGLDGKNGVIEITSKENKDILNAIKK